MSDEPENIVLILLRGIDTKLDRLSDDLCDLTVRMTAGEEGMAGIHRRLDRIEDRLARVERRRDLIDAAPA